MKALTAALLPEEFLQSIQANPSIMLDIKDKPDTGLAFFNFCEIEAGKRFKAGCLEITRAGIWLEIIREHKLYEFGGFKNWTAFLDNWVETGARGRSRVLDMLMAMRIWKGETINRPLEELLLFEEGVASIEPILVGPKRIIDDAGNGGYNTRTGEIQKLKREWEDRLDGDTVAEKVNVLIDSLPKEATKVSTRNMLSDEIPKAKCEFFPQFTNGVCTGFIAHFYDAEGHITQEITVSCPEFWAAAREIGLDGKMMAMFRFPMEWRNG